jgi:hypothetical protein
MATIHFLNVREGDCIVVQHNSDRVSMIDISCGNITEIEESTNRFIKSSGLAGAKTGSNFNMKAYPTKPQNYLGVASENGKNRTLSLCRGWHPAV